MSKTTTPDRPRAEDIEAIKRLVEVSGFLPLSRGEKYQGRESVTIHEITLPAGTEAFDFYLAAEEGVPALVRAVRGRLGHTSVCDKWEHAGSSNFVAIFHDDRPCTCGTAEYEAALK